MRLYATPLLSTAPAFSGAGLVRKFAAQIIPDSFATRRRYTVARRFETGSLAAGFNNTTRLTAANGD